MNEAGATLSIHSHKVCLLYDPATGVIHHQHSVLTVSGGTEPSEEQMTADAQHAASRKPRTGMRLAALHVSGDAMKPGKLYKVDAARKVIVEG